jgi:hypothetical protein
MQKLQLMNFNKQIKKSIENIMENKNNKRKVNMQRNSE